MRHYMNARHRPGIFLLLLVLLLTGCAAPQTRQLLSSSTHLPRSVELRAIPFFPQERYQCGPAALATALNAAGVSVMPDELTPQVYLPERQGSLQFELLAATRRHGRVPYVIKPRLEAVMSEVAAGNPVLVLQNLGLDAVPIWHYAVVVGFDLDQANVVLRSGIEERRITSLQTFEHTWARGNHWGVVVMPPDRLPQTAEERPYLESVVTLEKLQRWRESATAYTTALKRWPQSLGAAMGLGNSRYALNDLPGAEEAFRAATLGHPEAGAAFNNLAQVLADQQRWEEAETAAQQAVAIGGSNSALFRLTLEEIQSHSRSR
jgi:tetratricopeptide (TPR) repeat protein